MSVLLALIFVAAASGTAPPATFDDVDYAFAAERDVVIKGVRLRVLESGPADGPRVLLLHCFGLSSQVWREVMPGLAAAGFHVVAYDAPGHGKSDKPARALTLRHLGEVAVAVLDALHWPDADLIGNSMGGMSALALLLFMLTLPLLTFFISPLSAWRSRQFEFEADAYAVANSQSSALSSALLKLYQDNAATLTPDPWFVAFYYSHPPAAQRLSRFAA